MNKITLVLVACVSLAACVTAPLRLAPPAETTEQQRARRLQQTSNWVLNGRVAVANGRDGGSGRFDWWQRGSAWRISLSAPVTGQSWSLSGGGGLARLEGLAGGAREDDVPDRLLYEAIGWDVPLQALAYWVRGLPGEAEAFGPPRLEHGDDGRLRRIQQGGWVIEYDRWQPADLGAGPVEMPHRLHARRGQARVRLLIDRWRGGAALP